MSIYFLLQIIEPPHDKTNKMAYAPSEDSDQPGPLHDKTFKATVRPAKTQISLGIRPVWSVFAVSMKKAWVLSYPFSTHEDSDQTGRIWFFAGRTCHFVGFVTRRLISPPPDLADQHQMSLGAAKPTKSHAYSEISDQPAHLCSRISLHSLHEELTEEGLDPWLPRMIRQPRCAGWSESLRGTCDFVGFAVLWLNQFTLSIISLVCAALRQNLARHFDKGVAGKPTTTVPKPRSRHRRPNALKYTIKIVHIRIPNHPKIWPRWFYHGLMHSKDTGRVKPIWCLIAYVSSEGSGKSAHPRSLARTSAARSYWQWVKRNLQTESQIPSPSEWLGMRS